MTTPIDDLKALRARLVKARRDSARTPEAATSTVASLQAQIEAVDKAIQDEEALGASFWDTEENDPPQA